MSDCGDLVSRRAWQRNRDVVEAPLGRDGKVVNVTSSIMTTPLIKSEPCSDMRGSSVRVVFVERTSGAWSSSTESIKAERIAL